MKITKRFIVGFVLMFVAAVVYTGCQKDRNQLEIDSDTSVAEDNSIAEEAFSDVFRDVNESADTANSLRSGCPVITVVSSTTVSPGFPKTVTIDYGSTGCNGKKGTITAVFTGPFLDSATVVSITYSNYYDGDYKVDATTHTITNTGRNSSGNYVYNISIVGAALVSSSGTIAWNATKSIEWLEGRSTISSSDDVFLISGTRTGTAQNGVAYTVTVSSSNPLKVATSCQWIMSGVVTLTPAEKTPRVIDFGSGACDNDATVSIGGTTYNVKL